MSAYDEARAAWKRLGREVQSRLLARLGTLRVPRAGADPGRLAAALLAGVGRELEARERQCEALSRQNKKLRRFVQHVGLRDPQIQSDVREFYTKSIDALNDPSRSFRREHEKA